MVNAVAEFCRSQFDALRIHGKIAHFSQLNLAKIFPHCYQISIAAAEEQNIFWCFVSAFQLFWGKTKAINMPAKPYYAGYIVASGQFNF